MNDLTPAAAGGTVRDSGLTTGDRVIAWTIASYANGGAQAWPSLRTLHDDTGLHVRSIRRVIDRLAARGVFAVMARPGRPTVYTFSTHPTVRPSAHTNGHEMSTGVRPSAQTRCAPYDRAGVRRGVPKCAPVGAPKY